MKTYYLLLLLIITIPCRGQAIHLRGSIVDAQTEQPIAGATISIMLKKLVYPSNDKGEFDITPGKITTTDSVAFSCIGYETKKLIVTSLSTFSVVKLVPVSNVLSEVKIGNSAYAHVGCKIQISKDTWSPSDSSELVMFMDGSKNVKGTIQTVSFYLSNGNGIFKGGDVTAPFRVRLFEVDTDGMPGKELTADTIIVRGSKNKQWLNVDLSAYHIQNPDSGFYAAFGLLPYKYYQARAVLCNGPFYQVAPEDMFSPRLGVIEHKTRVERSYFSCYSGENMDWHWQKDYYNWEYMIRATIAPE